MLCGVQTRCRCPQIAASVKNSGLALFLLFGAYARVIFHGDPDAFWLSVVELIGNDYSHFLFLRPHDSQTYWWLYEPMQGQGSKFLL